MLHVVPNLEPQNFIMRLRILNISEQEELYFIFEISVLSGRQKFILMVEKFGVKKSSFTLAPCSPQSSLWSFLTI
jgi:hypothetical protein